MTEQPPEDDNKRRLRELLAAKKKARQAGDTPHPHKEGRGGRLDPAKGSAGFKRRKV